MSKSLRGIGIYQITCLVDAGCYVGSSVTVQYRWAEHQRKLRQGRHYNPNLQRSWDEHGSANHVCQMLESISDRSMLAQQEQFWIDAVKPNFNIDKTATNKGQLAGRKSGLRATGCLKEHIPGVACNDCAAYRMAAYRKRRPDRAKAIDQRRTDTRRREEEAARAYVAAYLRRGRIAPPATCDACGDYSEHLRPWHPDPAQHRRVAWLCPEHRRSIPALAQPLILHWEWPGTGVTPTRPRWPRFVLDYKDVDAGLAAVRRAEVRGDIRNSGDRSRVFVDGFLASVGSKAVDALLALGLRSDDTWAPYGDESIDPHLRAWIGRERRRRDRERRLAPALELQEIRPTFEPRVRRDRHDRPRVQPPVSVAPKITRVPLDIDALDQLIASTNAMVDETISRVKSNLQASSKCP